MYALTHLVNTSSARINNGRHFMTTTFGLKGEDCIRVVTDAHLEEFTRDYGEDWRRIHSYLELKSIVVRDTDKKPVGEREKRHSFFAEWKFQKSDGATYEKLVSALLKIGNREDAEAVCEMLQSSKSSEFRELPVPSQEANTTPAGKVHEISMIL